MGVSKRALTRRAAPYITTYQIEKTRSMRAEGFVAVHKDGCPIIMQRLPAPRSRRRAAKKEDR